MKREDIDTANKLLEAVRDASELKRQVQILSDVDHERLSFVICDSGNSRNSIRIEANENKELFGIVFLEIFQHANRQLADSERKLAEFMPS